MLAADDIRRALLAKGMVQDAGDHEMFRKTLDVTTTLITKISWRGRRHDVAVGVVSAMAKQTCLQLAEFKDLIDCVLSEEQWDTRIRERCFDGRNLFLHRR